MQIRSAFSGMVMAVNDQEQYFNEAKRWEQTTAEQMAKSESRAWWIARIAVIFAAMCITAVMLMLPLKEKVTEVLVLDRANGTWQPLQKLEVTQLSLDEAFHRKFLNEFVLAREGYSFENAEHNYYTAAAYMAPQLQAEWGKFWDKENPRNPFNVYKKNPLRVEIATITTKRKEDGRMDVATVRFTRSTDPTRYWVATVTYRLVNEPKEERERRINPLGFQVIDYVVDAELPGTGQRVSAVQR